MRDDLKVNDREILYIAAYIEQCNYLDDVLKQYTVILGDILKRGICSGEIHDSLEKLHFYSSDILKCIEGSGEKGADEAKKFIKKIEEVDLELYKGA